GWRRVIVDENAPGPLARSVLPQIRQVFVGAGRDADDRESLERKLYVIRKRVEQLVRASGMPDSERFYIPSLSSRTIVYKGLLQPEQIPAFYADLTDSLFTSALALVHQRFSTNTFPSWDRAHPYRFIAHNGEINTLRGNINWMHARQAMFASPHFEDVRKLFPIIDPATSDSGMFDIPPANVLHKDRLQPGRMFLVDTEQGRIIGDEELKESMAARRPYRLWLDQNLKRLADLPPPSDVPPAYEPDTLLTRQQAFGYTVEDLRLLMSPMAINGQEAVGSMGTDTPLACLSDRPQLLFNYFKQLFAQVTNPPIDPIREELVMSLQTSIGPEQNLFDETALHCRQLHLKSPILTNAQLAQIKQLDDGHLHAITLPMLFPAGSGGAGLRAALEELCERAAEAVLKVMTKMGISTLHSYRGAQIFEAVGLNAELVERYFTWTASRIEGVGLDVIAAEAEARHEHAYVVSPSLDGDLDLGGQYQ